MEMYENELASSTEYQYYTALLQPRTDDLARSKDLIVVRYMGLGMLFQ
jgi:hypothetical protein